MVYSNGTRKNKWQLKPSSRDTWGASQKKTTQKYMGTDTNTNTNKCEYNLINRFFSTLLLTKTKIKTKKSIFLFLLFCRMK